MAQTTRDTSFGPVLAITTLPVMYFVSRNLYVQYDFSLVKKNVKKRKKNLPRAQTTHLASFGPVIVIPSIVVVVVVVVLVEMAGHHRHCGHILTHHDGGGGGGSGHV